MGSDKAMRDKDKRREYDRQYNRTYKAERVEYNRKYRKTHREKVRIYERQYAERIKVEVFTHYCNGEPFCVSCGIGDIDILTIDHLNGSGGKHRRSLNLHAGDRFYRWLKANGYPQEYQVLCYNCNIKKFKLSNKGLG